MPEDLLFRLIQAGQLQLQAYFNATGWGTGCLYLALAVSIPLLYMRAVKWRWPAMLLSCGLLATLAHAIEATWPLWLAVAVTVLVGCYELVRHNKQLSRSGLDRMFGFSLKLLQFYTIVITLALMMASMAELIGQPTTQQLSFVMPVLACTLAPATTVLWSRYKPLYQLKRLF